MLTHQFQFLSVPSVECPCTDNSTGISMPLLNLPYAVASDILPEVPETIADSLSIISRDFPPSCNRSGQESGQVFPYANWAASRPPSPMWLAERLMQVIVDRIETHQSGVGLAQNCVEVGSIVVHLPSRFVNNTGGLCDFDLE